MPHSVGAAVTDGSLFDLSPLPTLVLDADTLRILAANQAAEALYGYARAELLQLRLGALVAGDEAPRSMGSRTLADGSTVDFDVQRHRAKDGSEFPIYCASRQTQRGGMDVLVLGMAELGDVSTHRSHEQFADKMESMARLAGGIAHEFNNLLTAILGTADMVLASTDLPSALRSDLNDIREAGHRAAAIARQLVAFGGSQGLVLKPTAVNDVLRQLEPLMRRLLPSHVTLELQLRTEAVIQADQARLEEAVLGLVANAIEAMPDGGLVSVATRDPVELPPDAAPGASPGSYTLVAISDSGAGLSEVARARLFEPFFTTKEHGKGVGLSLASVYGTVRQLHGHIDVKSVLGSGTEVRLYFPTISSVKRVSEPLPDAVRDAQGSEVLLVVEDEPAVRAPICRTLRRLGYLVLEANNGEHALRVMQEHHAPVHLVITDVMMPEMRGTELVDLLRDWYPQMRVLFISGYSSQYLEARGGRVDGGSFLAKPFSLEVLARRVRELLDVDWGDEVEPGQAS